MVGFDNSDLLDEFLLNLSKTDPVQYGISRILGLPRRGAGLIEDFPLNEDGSFKNKISGAPGIVGLPDDYIRICTLSSDMVLDVLSKTLY